MEITGEEKLHFSLPKTVKYATMGFSSDGTMKRKHMKLVRGESRWTEPYGKRLWCITPVNLKSGMFVRRNKSWHRNKSVKRVRCMVYAYQINLQDKGMFDQFGPPKRLKFREWGNATAGVNPVVLGVLRGWGLANLPDWSSHWDRGWRDPCCVGDFAYWAAEVLSSRWWTDRAGVLRHAVLAPDGLEAWGVCITPTREVKSIWGRLLPSDFHPTGLGVTDAHGAVFSCDSPWVEGCAVTHLKRSECNAWDMGIKMLTDMRGKSGIPSLGALVAFVSRFWGKSLGESLKVEIKKHAHLSERWAWEGHR